MHCATCRRQLRPGEPRWALPEAGPDVAKCVYCGPFTPHEFNHYAALAGRASDERGGGTPTRSASKMMSELLATMGRRCNCTAKRS